ncbi:LysE/ArgO family amino acid transporter [Tuberibacillus calidus]|uniref:LysE/ArgO family amino acid transporter n=1 Tax=Tuberibacillus calidus TaxID=340097 RepID=UPI0004805EF4|nr:LysE/ArgO family amino acid transporter [Tuberibacillus calidus]
MMMAFVHGFVLALGLILPLGPQNVFVFNQGALHHRLTRALPAVITAALCDTLLIALAVLGVSVAVMAITWLKTVIFLIGFVFLILIGWQIWKSDATVQEAKKTAPLKQVVFALSVSLLNPHAILDTVGVIGTGSLAYVGKEKWVFTLSCILVSWLWFFGLALGGRLIGNVDREGRWINRLNKLSAIIIWIVAVYFFYQMFTNLI